MSFKYDDSGRLVAARSQDGVNFHSETNLTYTAMGNLKTESITSPLMGPTYTVSYNWQWIDNNRNRLTGITYPSGRTFDYDYGIDTDSVEYEVGRMTGMTEAEVGGNSVIRYTHTGGGRTISKVWGTAAVTLDYTPDPMSHLFLHYVRDASVLESAELAAARATPWRNKLAAEDWFAPLAVTYLRRGARFLKYG